LQLFTLTLLDVMLQNEAEKASSSALQKRAPQLGKANK